MTAASYRTLLHDFRADIFRQLTMVFAFFCLAAAYALLFMTPLPHPLVLFLFMFCAFTLYIRSMARRHLDLARYIFIAALYAGMVFAMILLRVSWLPFLVFPVVFIGEMVVSHANMFLAALFYAYTVFLAGIGHVDYPLQPLALFLCLMWTVSNRGINAIRLLLQWYSAGYQQNDDLLQAARNHRAELLQMMKSLEIAYETQHRLQMQLVHARQQADEARRMKERFASNISHELRTPLNIILGFTEIMQLTPEVYGDIVFPPKLQRDIYQVHRNSRHLLEMIDDVLDLSHIELSQFALNFEPTNLNHFLNDTVEMVSHLFHDKPVAFNVCIAENLPEVEIDRTRIRQVMINLLNNAARFTAAGSVTFSVEPRDGLIAFQVTDTGVGIAADKMHLIFEEFYQVDYSLSRSHGGAGLGLAITRRFIEAHNGTLAVASEENKGSTFTFTLPMPGKRYAITPDYAAAGSTAPDSLWLVVDADPHVGKLIARHMPGRRIVQVEDETLVEQSLRQYTPQGVIVNNPPDHPLPQHLAGLPVPVIVCSLPGTTSMVQKLGVAACLSKPVAPRQIVEQLQRYNGLCSILVVDDDIGVVQLVQRCIETSFPQMRVQRAYNGAQALEMMRTSPPDLVMLDLVMPEMSGFEVVEAMKNDERLASIAVILLTATRYIDSDEETRSEMRINQTGGLPPMGVLRLLDSVMGTLEKQAAL